MDQTAIHRYAIVETADGPVGHVKRVVIDRRTQQPTEIVVTHEGKQWLVPMSAVASTEGDRVVLRGAWSDYHETGTLGADDLEPLDRTHPGKPTAAPAGGIAPRGATEYAGQTSSPGPWRVQLREERVRVDKQQEQAGSVRVGKRVTERVETLDVPVREERVIIEHRPGSGQVTVGDKQLREDETIDVPVMRERVVVRKEPVVVEEVTVRKEVIERTDHTSETVRKEELVIDDPRQLVRADASPSTDGKGNTKPAAGQTPGMPQP
jgi:uncharacterized protein (TIGR02271 family)